MAKKNYNELTKKELVEICKTNDLLASSVEGKNQEMKNLREAFKNEKADLIKSLEAQHKAEVELATKQIKEMEEFINTQRGYINSLLTEGRTILTRFEGVLQVLQGTTDNNTDLLRFSRSVFNSTVPTKK